MQFTVGPKLKGQADRTVVNAEDALIAAAPIEKQSGAPDIFGPTRLAIRVR